MGKLMERSDEDANTVAGKTLREMKERKKSDWIQKYLRTWKTRLLGINYKSEKMQ